MKAKKALRRLDHVEALISDVLGRYTAKHQGVRELLDSAKESVSSAIKALHASASTGKSKKPAEPQKPQHVVASTRKKSAPAAKKATAVKRSATKKSSKRAPAARKKAAGTKARGAARPNRPPAVKTIPVAERSEAATYGTSDQPTNL